MTQEDKELLLKDLCARLPHGVMLSTPNGNKPLLALVSSKKYDTICVYDDYCGNEDDISEWEGGDIEFVKPYLRPMSSMIEEEKKELKELHFYYTDGHIVNDEDKDFKPIIVDEVHCFCIIDWLNAHHFDYRGLIEKGLALEAPEGMYNTK